MFSTSTFAQEKAGSTSVHGSTLGAVTLLVVVVVVVVVVVARVSALAVLTGISSNSKGTITPVVVVPGPEPTCNGIDPLVDGVCTVTTTTVTVTGTTNGTVNVPVTFTYVPAL
jgi:hypothetical protein